jgi:hypothetical protein
MGNNKKKKRKKEDISKYHTKIRKTKHQSNKIHYKKTGNKCIQ